MKPTRRGFLASLFALPAAVKAVAAGRVAPAPPIPADVDEIIKGIWSAKSENTLTHATIRGLTPADLAGLHEQEARLAQDLARRLSTHEETQTNPPLPQLSDGQIRH
jgi:hypothetical protein